ncbi:hypothetical protein AR457_03270 [Streptomyces agglomeratus]|uniref:DUF4232 domain-containing protein n=1 Tax=Streptomyces agglomeratus TaxID=285458 RepID=A0A1E5P2B8_9ACTN|nr:DUF4232 domain-containing protein [Streptomyces agglomeratus]OEJ23659.1 hypothetical protein AS594_03375 [Streptomyces agglomeratus]OEJ43251.1 hypothetical protein AR457_03270 [Streptomyces agglomeratus]OEJ54829.1 hypothetical protein BGK72_32500 [Streptomyces agglomeratus]OEJ62201.1 hypothetical protein BGM19_33410 [Streptomyces agglomeratus]
MRTFISRPAVLATTAVAALSLTLTACGDDGAKDKAATGSASVSKSLGEGAGKKDTAAGGESGAGTSGSGTSGSGTSGSGTSGSVTSGTGTTGTGTSGSTGSATQAGANKKPAANAPACGVNDVRISAAKQGGVPTTHITLTATNVSGHACTLLQYPLIAFGDVPQTAKDVPAVAKSKPGAPIVLNAGAPAYAAVRINQGGVDETNHAVTSFYVNLFAADGPAEGSKNVTAPNGGIAVNDAVAKTGYWTYELRNGADDF